MRYIFLQLFSTSFPLFFDSKVSRISNKWNFLNAGNDSESSEGEDDVVQPEPVNGDRTVKGIVSADGVRYESIARMPYRSRNAVYSPTPPLNDAHNDSGYSTRMYGSSKGASPSLSGVN